MILPQTAVGGYGIIIIEEDYEFIVDGYSHYDKFIKSGRILFVYSLTYPDSYKPAMPRLFKLIDDWKVLGAY